MIAFVQLRNSCSFSALQLPWKEMGIDLVIEGTGVFVDSKGAGKHVEVHSLLYPHALGASEERPPIHPAVYTLWSVGCSTCLSERVGRRNGLPSGHVS